MSDKQSFTIAIAKGRLLSSLRCVLDRAGLTPEEDPDSTRRLVLGTSDVNTKIMIVRSADVPTYVRYGTADMGIVGKDVIMESPDDLYEMLDFGIARCRLVVAEPIRKQALEGEGLAGEEIADGERAGEHSSASFTPNSTRRAPTRLSRRIRVATKYPHTARVHFARKGVQVQVIHLYGSMELAPLMGLADQIVDLVDTGSTLAANHLVEVETVADISARLIVNPAAYKMKRAGADELIQRLSKNIID